MWLAAVCPLIVSSSPISRLLSPRGDQLQNLCLAWGEPAGETSCGVLTPSARIFAEQSPHADPLGQAGGLTEQACAVTGPPAPPEQKTRVLVGGMSHPGRCPHAPVLLQGKLEVLLGSPMLAERRSEHSQVAVGGSIAGDQMADHHVAPRERLQLGIDDRRHRLVTQRSTGVTQVGERRQPQRRLVAIDAFGGKLESSRFASRSMPSSASTATSPGRHGPSRSASRARILIDRRELCQAPLLAANTEHLDAVGARRITPSEQQGPIVRAPGHRLGFREIPVAESDRRPVVLGDVVHERLRGPLGHLAQHNDLRSGGLEVAESDEGRYAPGHRLCVGLGVPQLVRKVPSLGQHREDLLQ